MTCSATAFPARPKLRTSSGCSRKKRTAPASASPRGSQTRPVRRAAATASGPPPAGPGPTGLSAGRRARRVGPVARDRSRPRRLAGRARVEPVNCPPQRPVLRRLGELAELGAVEVVRLPELVHEPDHLAPVPHDVGGELRPDHKVDRPPVSLLEVDEPPEEGLAEDARPWIPLERHGDERGEVVARVELADELLRRP